MALRSPRRSDLARRPRRCLATLEALESKSLLASAVHQPLVIATLGDSLTDEYTFYGPLSASDDGLTSSGLTLPATADTVGRSSSRNWVSNLAASRSSQVTFGSYSTTSRGETRNQGFAENWALSGATANGLDIANDGTTFAEQYDGFPKQSLPGLLTQKASQSGGLTSKSVNVVTILIGDNDYAAGLIEYAETNGTLDVFQSSRKGSPDSVNAGIETAIKNAVAHVHAKIPGAKVVVITPPDITIAPLVASNLASELPTSISELGPTITNSVSDLGSDLGKLAARQHFGLVDTQTLFDQARNSPTVDGLTVDLGASGQDLTDGFVGDGFHPGTILQGKLAQAIVAKIDLMEKSNVITPLTDADILGYADATQSNVTLTSQASATDAGQSTLTALVASGPGNTTAPTGTVTFESITPASGTTPAQFGNILGTVPVDPSGLATLDVADTSLDSATFYAVYSGDEAHTARISNGLAPASSLV